MPATLAPHPSLSPPVALGSYTSSAGAAANACFQTNAASSSRLSHAGVGEVVKISSSSLKRARGLIAIVAAGNAVTLFDAVTHAAVQSFVLSQSVHPCTPPLVTLQSGSKGTTIRRTYLGVVASNGNGSEIWSWSETIKDSATAAIDASPKRVTVQTQEAVVSLHALASGEVLLRLASGNYTILSSSPAEAEQQTLQLVELVSSSNGPTSSSSSSSSSLRPRLITHSVTVLDALGATHIFGGSLPTEEALAYIFTITSAARPFATLTSASADLSISSSKEKKGRRRKTAIEVIDDVDGYSSSRDALAAFGPLKVQVQLVGATGAPNRLRSLGEAPVPGIEDSSSLLDVNFFHDGHLSILTRLGEIVFSNLTISTAQGPQVSHPRTLALRHLAQDPMPSAPAALLRLSPSHLLIVLRAATGPSSGRFAALIWDTELDALIVTQDWSVPWAVGLEEGDRRISLTITRVGGSQVVVEGCSWEGDRAGAKTGAVATLWALPFTIPSSSVLRHAVGKAVLTTLWSGQTKDETLPSSKQTGASVDEHQRGLLQRLQNISGSNSFDGVEKKAVEMDTVFASWLSEEGARAKAAWMKQRMGSQAAEANLAAEAQSGSDDSAREAVEQATEEERREALASKQRQQRADKTPKVKLPYPFVVALLHLAIPATSAVAGPVLYAKKILSYLMSRKAVSCGMLAGSDQTLIGRLRARNDWSQIMATVRNVSDVAEGELVELLVELLKNERSDSAEGKASDKVPLDVFLSQFVTMAVSRPLLRSTLHGQVSDSEDVVTLLQVITRWLEERGKQSLDLVSLSGSETNGSSSGAMAVVTAAKKSQSGSRRKRLGDGVSQAKAPPTTDLLQFAMDLIDVYFPLLLNTSSTHQALQSLTRALSVHLSLCSSLATLRGPLDAFTRLDSDRRRLQEENVRRVAIQRAGDPRIAKQMKVTTGGPGVGGMEAVQARSETGGGLALQGLAKSVRLHALESSALIGPYTVESLEV